MGEAVVVEIDQALVLDVLLLLNPPIHLIFIIKGNRFTQFSY